VSGEGSERCRLQAHAGAGNLLAQTTLIWLRTQSTEYLLGTLTQGGQDEQLEWDNAGQVLEGNHRVRVLIERGFDIDSLAREVWNARNDAEDAGS